MRRGSPFDVFGASDIKSRSLARLRGVRRQVGIILDVNGRDNRDQLAHLSKKRGPTPPLTYVWGNDCADPDRDVVVHLFQLWGLGHIRSCGTPEYNHAHHGLLQGLCGGGSLG
jgi:hypothetical protein